MTDEPTSPDHDPDGDGVWRDEERLPLRDLSLAMATNAADGQADDETGGDAGAEEARVREETDGSGGGDEGDGSQRRWRPSPDGPGPAGRSGPT